MEVIFFISLLLFLAGILIKYGKFYWLIPGWSSMADHEKKKMDIDGLGGFVGNGAFLLALVLIVGELLNQFIVNVDLLPISLFLFVAITSYIIMSSPIYHKDNQKKEENIKNIKKNALVVGATIFLSGLVILGFINFALF